MAHLLARLFFILVCPASAARCYILVAPSRRKIGCLPRVLIYGAFSCAAALSLEYLEDSLASGYDIFFMSSPFKSSEFGALIRPGSELCLRGRSHGLKRWQSSTLSDARTQCKPHACRANRPHFLQRRCCTRMCPCLLPGLCTFREKLIENDLPFVRDAF